MKIGIRGQVTDIITYANILVNRFNGYRVMTPQKCYFPLTCCVTLTAVRTIVRRCNEFIAEILFYIIDCLKINLCFFRQIMWLRTISFRHWGWKI